MSIIKSETAREIFERLHAHIKFDGHTASIWKDDLISIAKEYGVDLNVYENNTAVFSVGDVIASDNVPNLIGTIINLPRKGGRGDGLALVRVCEGTDKEKNLLVALPHWHKITKKLDRCETSFQEDLEFFVNDCTKAQLEALYERVGEKLKEDK